MSLKLAGSLRFGSGLFGAVLLLSACFDSAEQKHASYMQEGREYAEQGDHKRAVLQFKNALRTLPDDSEAHYELGKALLATNNPAEAMQAFLRATELDPKHARAQLQVAELMIAAGREQFAPEAAQRMEVVLDGLPNDGDAHFVMAAAKMRMGSEEEAKHHLQEALRNSPSDLKSTVALAAIKLNQKDWEGAEALLRSAVERAPDEPEPALALGHLYSLMNKDQQAEQQFREALKISPTHVPSMLAMAGLHLRQGREPEAEELYRRVSEVSERYGSAYAEFLVHQGREQEAISVLEDLHRRAPGDALARSRLVSAYLAAGRQDDARRMLDLALMDSPSDVRARLQRGHLNLLEGRLKAAEEDLTEVVRSEPQWVAGRYLLGKVHLANGSAFLHRRELERAVELDPAFLSARLDLARSFLSEGAAESALDLLNEMPEKQAALIPSIVMRNWALMAANNWAEVHRSVERGLAKEKVPELLLQAGIEQLRRGEIGSARSSLRQALDEDPAELRAMITLAQTYLAEDEPAKAAEEFRQYAANAPNSHRAQLVLGDWLLANNDPPGARRAYEAALVNESADSAAVRLKLARLDVSQGKPADARRRLLAVLADDPANSEVGLLLGMTEESLNNYDEAREHYQQVVNDDPYNAIALNNLAYRLATDTQQLDTALAYAQRAKELAPENHSVSDTLGWIYYLKGLYQTALPHIEAAASGLSDEASVQYHLAMVRWKLGHRQRAEKALRVAQALDPEAPEALAAQRLFSGAHRDGGD